MCSAFRRGEFLSRLISDTADSSSVLTTGVFKLLAAAVTFVVAAALMVTIEPVLFALSLAITAIANWSRLGHTPTRPSLLRTA